MLPGNTTKILTTGLMALLFLVSAFVGQTLAQDTVAKEPNKVIVQFSEDALPLLNRGMAETQARTSISSIDALHQQLNVVSMTQTIRTDPRYAAQHTAYGLDRWYTIEFDASLSVSEVVEMYSLDEYIRYAEPSYKYETLGMPASDPFSAEELAELMNGDLPTDDPRLDEQWHYNNTGQTDGTPGADISLFPAWEIEQGTSDIIVQVVDTGIDINHPDLQNMHWINPFPGPENGYDGDIHGWSHVTSSSDIQDVNGHGSHCAGTIAAQNNNGIGVAGVAGGDGSEDSGVRIMTSRVFVGATGGGGFAEAIVYGADNGAVISSNSWGGGGASQVLRDAILYFIETAGFDENGNPQGPIQGGLVIFAAGNNGSATASHPIASNPEVMAVASTNHNDQKSWFSQYGDWIHLSAPGGETTDPSGNLIAGGTRGVLSTVTNGNYQFYQGTSMAAPHASGLAALIASSFKDDGITGDGIFERMMATVDPIGDLNPQFDMGDGRINAFRALEQDDGIAPSTIADLAATESQQTAVRLEWTAPGSSGDQGQAFEYDIRYSTSPINSGNFSSAERFETSFRPSAAGTEQSLLVTGLDHSTDYYFAIKASDFFGNESEISNTTSATTEGSPEIVIQPSELNAQADEDGDVVTRTISVSNEGNATLDFSIAGANAAELLASRGLHNETSLQYEDITLEKGAADFREGHEVILGAGGPDEFGYSWTDSNDDSGVVFDWVEISDVGTPLTALSGTWDDNTSIDLPFSFPFYGEEYETARVSVNGWIHFGSFTGDAFSNREIPSTQQPSNLLAVLWDDLDMRTTGTVYTYHDESANRFIIQWNAVPKSFSNGSSFTFQAILEQGGSVTYQYQQLSGNTSENTVGIENQDGTDGLQVAFNTGYLENGLAVRFSSGPEWVTFDQTSGSVEPGETLELTAFFDPEGLATGFYTDELRFSNNTVGMTTKTVPVYFQIGDIVGDLVFNTSEIDFGSIFANASVTEFINVQNTGNGLAEVTSITSDNDAFIPGETSFSLAPGSSKQIPVTFNPDQVSTYSGTITIETDIEDSEPFEVSLFGRSLLAPEAGFSLADSRFNLITGETAESSFEISNSSYPPLEFEIAVADASMLRAITGETKAEETSGLRVFSSFVNERDSFSLFSDATSYGVEMDESDLRTDFRTAVFAKGSASVLYGITRDGTLERQNIISGNSRTVAELGSLNGYASDLSISQSGEILVLAGSETGSSIYRLDDEGITLQHQLDVAFRYMTELPSGNLILATSSGELYRLVTQTEDSASEYELQRNGKLAHSGQLAGIEWNHDYGLLIGAFNTSESSELVHINMMTASFETISRSDLQTGWFSMPAEGLQSLSDWIQTDPESGSVGSNASITGTLSVDASEISPADYDLELQVYTNDPLAEMIVVPFEVQVFGEAKAFVQLIHNAADPAAESVDVYVNGELFAEGFSFREATAFVPAPAETELEISILPAGSESTAASLFDVNLTLDRNENYTIIANGVLNPAEFAGVPSDTEFNLYVLESPMRESDDSESISAVFFHGVTDAPNVDISFRDSDFLAENLAYGEFGEYFYAGADEQIFDIFETGMSQFMSIFVADFSVLAGESATMLLSGFADPGNNMNGSSLAMLAVLPSGEVLMPRDATSSGDEQTDVPTEFVLEQNYPNPFNPTTQISYSIPEAANVTLEVYNVQGQLVAVLVNGQQNAGSHSVSFDANRLSSGMYLYRIQAGSFTAVRKMMLLK
ncbi:MAG: S8 family serine peptidase [Balneolia bacterium]|nr:S8 family serine peptidase [Balneolia bacterium]